MSQQQLKITPTTNECAFTIIAYVLVSKTIKLKVKSSQLFSATKQSNFDFDGLTTVALFCPGTVCRLVIDMRHDVIAGFCHKFT